MRMLGAKWDETSLSNGEIDWMRNHFLKCFLTLRTGNPSTELLRWLAVFVGDCPKKEGEACDARLF